MEIQRGQGQAVHSAQIKASIITKYFPGLLPPTSSRTANSSVSSAEHCRRSRTGNESASFQSRGESSSIIAPSSPSPDFNSDWVIYTVNVTNSNFSSSMCLEPPSSTHQAQLSQTAHTSWNHPNTDIIKMNMKNAWYHR